MGVVLANMGTANANIRYLGAGLGPASGAPVEDATRQAHDLAFAVAADVAGFKLRSGLLGLVRLNLLAH